MTWQLVDEYGDHDYCYVTDRPDQMMHFCDFTCLVEYAEMKKERYDKQKERDLRAETSYNR